MATSTMENQKVVSRVEWLAARKELLAKEKEFTHLRDELSRQRIALPWVKVDKNYVFDGPNGRQSLSDLFEGRSQLIIYHFMFGPGWGEGCVGCSFLSDHLSGPLMHLPNHDVSLVVVSRAPLTEIEPFRKRMGWNFKWFSSNGSDFNYDYHVSFDKEDASKGKVYYNFEMREPFGEEMPGVSVFYKNANSDIFHTYSSYARGGESFISTYSFLDIAPKGRNETGPRHDLSDWVRHHDRYNAGGVMLPSGRYQAEEKSDTCCHAENN